METLLNIVVTINALLSDYVLIILLLSLGIFYTIRTKFVQVRFFGEGLRNLFGNFSLHGPKQTGELSSFQALTTALAAQVGTGNVVGASGAILIGGPGAIFWMWIIAFFGMATIYAEAVLAQKTRIQHADGSFSGGPVYYITYAFQGSFGKFLAGFFAIAIVLALGFAGCMVQSNSIAATFHTAFGLPTWLVGILVATLAGFIIIGGISRIGRVTEKLVPAMAILFILGCLAVIISRIEHLPETLGMIFRFAFSPEAVIGGSFGSALKIAISQGAKRGLFSNEAGMGSTPHAHAIAKVKNPHDQGVVAMIGVFIDTFVILTLIAITVISVLYANNGPLLHGPVANIDSTNMAQLAFSDLLGKELGQAFVAICLFFFAFSTIISWNYFGKVNVEYLFGKIGVKIYSVISVLFVLAGSLASNTLVWELCDMFNQLMVIPNAIALFALGSLVVNVITGKDKNN